MKRHWLMACLLAAIVATPVVACLWDSDTLQMERRRFPDALELIAGKFLRHSPDFYQWRVEDRQRRLQHDPQQIALYDDLAVALDKLGRHDEALQVIQQKEALQPGLYETYANWGTFLIHGGRLEEGKEKIAQAIQINPDAHFGREIYQQLLVEYVLQATTEEGLVLPIAEEFSNNSGFARFVLQARLPEAHDRRQEQEEISKAIKGVLGMVRFGQHDSPVLMEVLGDLLLGDVNADAKQLAARAYLRASYQVESEGAREAYRQRAEEALRMQVRKPNTHDPLPLAELEAQFRREREDAEAWFSELVALEKQWIESGQDPEKRYSETFTAEPRLSSWEAGDSGFSEKSTSAWIWPSLVVVAVCFAVSMLVLWKQWRSISY